MKIRGFSLIEVVVAMGVFSIVVFSIIELFIASQEAGSIGREKTKAGYLLSGYLEDIRNIRRNGWNNLVNGRYILVSSGGNLNSQATTSGELIDNFNRHLLIEDASRDDTGKLVSSGGTVDPSTKKVTVTVSWTGLHPGQISQTTYLTRYMDNLAWTQTTDTDFNTGTKNGVAVINNSGGEVILGAGGQGDWCNPNQAIVAQLDLPKNGVANALSAYEGRAIAGTGENASGVSLADISISNSNPPIPTIQGTANEYKTNDVFLEGNYAYLATDDNQKEVVIIDLTTYLEVGYFNVPFNPNATSIFVSGNRGYVTAGLFLYIFDLTSKIGARPQLGSFFFLGIATSVTVNGNYAYVSLASSPIEMQIINIVDPQQLSNTGWANVNGTDGKRIFVNPSGTRAYLATGASSSRREFFIIDISTKSGARPTVGSYEANGMNPKNLSVVPGNKAILVGSGAEEYQVIDISSEANPVYCGGVNIDAGVRGVVGILEADGDAYSYIVTGDANAEFKIIEGGPGGQYSASGMYESTTLDAGHQTAFNRFFVTFDAPPLSSIRFKVSVKDPAGASCTSTTFDNLDFVGPDGTSLTYFSGDSAMPLNNDGSGFENPGQCFRYRAYLETTDFTQTPTLYDFTVNYSP